MKFIHAADLHIDSPLLGLNAYEGAPAERIRGATRAALIALVDLALAERVDLVALAGDIYDGNWQDFKTGLFFREQMVRLARAGVRVFIAKGNHDAESVITKALPGVAGVHIFSSRKAECIELPEIGVAVHGRSFPEKAVVEDLLPGYSAPVPGRFNLGILHTSLAGNIEHPTYAPTTAAALCAKGYDYFALGHIHKREIVRESSPRIVYAGNLQGRHARETGSKGCELVVVEEGRIVSAEHVSLDVVRWHQIVLDATGVQTLEALASRFAQAAQAHADGARERLHAVRLLIEGESELAQREAEQPGTLAAAIQAATQELDGIEVWIEKVKIDLRSPIDRASAAERPDAVGDVIRLVDELQADEARLKAWMGEQLREMKNLPFGLLDADPAALDAEALRAALAEAESTLLAHLHSASQQGAGA
ncbi:MAG: metallophosphoesterase [Variovorax sp.]|nr:metallophosphoesterase [Variovorax sp.]